MNQKVGANNAVLGEAGELLRDAERLARGAGEVLRGCYARGPALERKGFIDLVTDGDRAAEAYILERLQKDYPDHGILAEESGAHGGAGAYRWVIDPLDGTTNFAHGIPIFCVLIAVQKRGANGAFETIAGVTFDPVRDELYSASRGGRAWCNGRSIAVSRVERLIDGVLATGFGYERLFEPSQDNHAEYCRMNLISQGVRRLGSAGLDLAWVACGRFSGFWEYGLRPWDVCAGALLVQEAGGRVSCLDGSRWPCGEGTLAASNGLLHQPLLDALGSVADFPPNSRQGLAAHLPPELAARLQHAVDLGA